jgi:hypothetical protein
MKTKGQQPRVSTLELLALYNFRGGLAERSNAADCKSVNGGHTTVLGFESLTRLKISSPAKALTSAREIDRTAEAARIRKFSIRLLAVELNRRFHSDLPQLPNRCPESRETSQWTPALSLLSVLQNLH